MRIHILDKKIIKEKSWFLGKISLWDYLSSVNMENFEFDIQRGIVKNKYLDSILQSVHNGESIPPITITANNINNEKADFIDIKDGDFNILDGLQRTYRLWLYKKIAEIAIPKIDLFNNKEYDIQNVVSTLKEKSYYIPGVLSISQIKRLLNDSETVSVTNIEEIYRKFDIYLYVWIGLDEKEIIQKMLILNAGQRKVSIGHQYELMFLQIIKDKNLIPEVSLIREKASNYGSVRNGNRNIGEFIFSSAIIGIQSLIAGKPIRLSSENLELGTEDDYISEEEVTEYFNQPFLNIYLKSLYEIDKELSEKNELYLKWFVKDTTISGIMGAIGEYMKNNKKEYKEVSDILIQQIKTYDCFKIKEFYLEYSNLSSQKINIGDKVRKAISTYTSGILNNSSVTWTDAFTNNAY